MPLVGFGTTHHVCKDRRKVVVVCGDFSGVSAGVNVASILLGGHALRERMEEVLNHHADQKGDEKTQGLDQGDPKLGGCTSSRSVIAIAKIHDVRAVWRLCNIGCCWAASRECVACLSKLTRKRVTSSTGMFGTTSSIGRKLFSVWGGVECYSGR